MKSPKKAAQRYVTVAFVQIVADRARLYGLDQYGRVWALATNGGFADLSNLRPADWKVIASPQIEAL